ncbi:D-tyrosyl-tRNA(Tyr) deacylase [Andreesenia angusta]|uniref:D-aminoacyl-tRNA deacylase n=1 Tax=Andreesenia angusta TaxID=39480 RepID=A0A1S1V7K4_9FIRM|nr:D-tyrosyl-tRNA(Tyr) deacylase [Andreesenia angusta]
MCTGSQDRGDFLRAVVQRVKRSSVVVDGNTVGEIGGGLLVLLGVGREDTEEDLEYIYEKTLKLRIFEDENNKMNLSLLDIGGDIQVVSQFTLYGDARKGRRPSFSSSAAPDIAEGYYEKLIEKFRNTEGLGTVATGEFGADMKVELLNDGPVTIMLDSKRLF